MQNERNFSEIIEVLTWIFEKLRMSSKIFGIIRNIQESLEKLRETLEVFGISMISKKFVLHGKFSDYFSNSSVISIDFWWFNNVFRRLFGFSRKFTKGFDNFWWFPMFYGNFLMISVLFLKFSKFLHETLTMAMAYIF